MSLLCARSLLLTLFLLYLLLFLYILFTTLQAFFLTPTLLPLLFAFHFLFSSISFPPFMKHQIDAEAADKLGQKYGQVENLTGAWHSKGGKLEYEVHFYGTKDKDNKYICRDDLDAMGFGPLCRQVCVSCCLYYISIFQ